MTFQLALFLMLALPLNISFVNDRGNNDDQAYMSVRMNIHTDKKPRLLFTKASFRFLVENVGHMFLSNGCLGANAGLTITSSHGTHFAILSSCLSNLHFHLPACCMISLLARFLP